VSERLSERGPSGPAAGHERTAPRETIDKLGPAEGVDQESTADGEASADHAGRRLHPALLIGGLLAILAVPLIVALGALHNPRWYPLLDLAQTELRVRDVGTRHSPLVGLAGRIQAYGQQGSHPGPISFWGLAVFYRLYGGSAFAMQAACVTLHLIAMGGILAVSHRRGGARLALAFAAVLAVLTHAYGAGTLTEAWNPYMPVLWWLLFLVAIWSVLLDDLAMLPVAVFAGSFCLQTHISYSGLVGAVTGLTVAVVAVETWRRRRDDPARVRSAVRWGALAAGLGVVLWIPTIVDQIIHDPGNASMIVENFRNPSDDPIGMRAAGEMFGVHLNLWRLLAGESAITGSAIPALLLLAVWAASAVVAWRLRHRMLIRLHALLAVVLVLGQISLSRVFGGVWYYLALWAWGITALMLVAIVWTAGAALAERGVGAQHVQRAALAGTAALAAVLVVFTAMFTVDATDAEVPAVSLSRQLSRLAPDTVAALESGEAPGGGSDGRYLVTWTDPVGIGATGFGLLLELEREGFDVGVPSFHATGAVPHRVLDPAEVTAEVHLAVGGNVAEWRANPAAVEVARAGLSDAEQARYDDLKAEIVDTMNEQGVGDLAPRIDDGMMAVAIDPRLSTELQGMMERLAAIGQPAAVFVAPPSGL
jgi:hypothetical protein